MKYNNVRALENNSPFLINSSSKMDANGILRDAMLTVVENQGVFFHDSVSHKKLQLKYKWVLIKATIKHNSTLESLDG